MSQTRFEFDGDASRLISAMRQMQSEQRTESQLRRTAASVERQLDREQQARLRERIQHGKEATAAQREQSQAAVNAVRSTLPSFENYNQSLKDLEKHLDGTAAGTKRYADEKKRLLAAVQKSVEAAAKEATQLRKTGQAERDANRERSERIRQQITQGKKAAAAQKRMSAEAREAIRSVLPAFDEYQRELFELDQLLKRGGISTDEYKRKKFDLLRGLRDVRREQSGENEQLRIAAGLVRDAKTETDRYREKIVALDKALRRGKITQQEHANAVKKAGADFRAAGHSSRTFGRQVASAAGALTGITGGIAAALKIIAELRQEYERLIEAQKEAAAEHITLAGAQSQAVKNLGRDELTPAQLFDRIRKESINIGIDEVKLTRAVSDALSARGAGTAEDSLEAVLAAARYERFGDSGVLETLAASSLDISKRANLDKEAALGFLSRIGELSRVTNTDALSQNIAPAVVNALGSGVSKEFAGALVAALSQGIVDEHGRVSRTALTSVITGIEKFDPGANIEETFKKLASDPELFKKFTATKGVSFEKKALFSVRELFTANTEIQKTFLEGLKALRDTDFKQKFQEEVAATEDLPSVRLARLEQESKNLASQLRLADIEGAQSGIIRESLEQIRKAAGVGSFRSKLDQIIADFDSGGVQGLPNLKLQLEQIQRTIEGVSQPQVKTAAGGRTLITTPGRALTNTEKSQVRLLGVLIDKISNTTALDVLGPPVDVQGGNNQKPEAAINLPEQPAPVVNVAPASAPIVEVPEQAAPVVNVSPAPTSAPVVEVPEQAAPVVNVSPAPTSAPIVEVPKQAVPVVNVAPAPVVLPEAPETTVSVSLPDQPKNENEEKAEVLETLRLIKLESRGTSLSFDVGAILRQVKSGQLSTLAEIKTAVASLVTESTAPDVSPLVAEIQKPQIDRLSRAVESIEVPAAPAPIVTEQPTPPPSPVPNIVLPEQPAPEQPDVAVTVESKPVVEAPQIVVEAPQLAQQESAEPIVDPDTRETPDLSTIPGGALTDWEISQRQLRDTPDEPAPEVPPEIAVDVPETRVDVPPAKITVDLSSVVGGLEVLREVNLSCLETLNLIEQNTRNGITVSDLRELLRADEPPGSSVAISRYQGAGRRVSP